MNTSVWSKTARVYVTAAATAPAYFQRFVESGLLFGVGKRLGL